MRLGAEASWVRSKVAMMLINDQASDIYQGTSVPEYDIEPPPDRLSDQVQLRTAFMIDKGAVVRFMTQLEYWLDGDWQAIVRYDHDRDAPGGHDITKEGLHLDIYRDGTKVRTERVTGPIPANDGFEVAEEAYT